MRLRSGCLFDHRLIRGHSRFIISPGRLQASRTPGAWEHERAARYPLHCLREAGSGIFRAVGFAGPRIVGIVPVPGQALLVIAEHLENTAFTHPSAGAFADHAVEFGFQFRQQLDAATNQLPMAARHLVDLRTRTLPVSGQFEKLPDLFDRKAELARVPNKVQTPLIGLSGMQRTT